MIDELEQLTTEFATLEESLADPELLSDQVRYRKAMQRYGELRPLVEAYRSYSSLLTEREEATALLQDDELAGMAREELARLEPEIERLGAELERLLLPRDPFDDKSVIVEIRAAAGGGEA